MEACAWFDAHEARSRKNARVADKVMVALPVELDDEQRAALVSDFVEALTDRRAPWLAAIHSAGKDRKNPHAHVVIVDRDPETGRRVIGLSEKGSTDRVRALWEERANKALAAAGVAARIDRRSLANQGIDRQAEIHVGPKSQAISARGIEPVTQAREYRKSAGAWTSDDPNRVVDYCSIDAGSRAGRRAEIVAANMAANDALRWASMAETWEACAQQLADDREAQARRAIECAWPIMPADDIVDTPADTPAGAWEAWARAIERAMHARLAAAARRDPRRYRAP